MRNNTAQFKFKPFSDQQIRLISWWLPDSPHSDNDIVMADGSIRAGKTVAMINGFLDWSLAEFEDENFIIAGKSMGALTRNVINPMKKILNAKGIQYNHVRSTEEPRLEIGTNYYYLFGANNVSSKDTLQGLTAAGSLADQVELFPENFVNEMVGRCSVEDSKHWWNSNPEGPFHWLKKEWIDEKENKNIYYLHFTMKDNLTLSQKIIDRYKRLYSGIFYDRYILGKWVKAEGIIYNTFTDDNLIDFADIPKHKKEWISIDYGTANDTVFLLTRLGKDNKLYIADEWRYGAKNDGQPKDDTQLRVELQEFIKRNNAHPEWILIDPSAKSFITELYHHRNEFEAFYKVSGANNTVLDGIRRVSSLLHNNVLLVNRDLEKLQEEFHSYSWDPKAQERGEDKPIKKYDHGLDAARYIINSNQRIVKMVLSKST